MKIRRSQFVTLLLQDRDTLQVSSLLQGEFRIGVNTELTAAALVADAELTIGEQELRALLATRTGEWRDRRQVETEARTDPGVVDRLLKAGLLLSNEEKDRDREKLDEVLADSGWDPYAAVYHYTSRWRGVHLDMELNVAPGTIQAAVPPATSEGVSGDGGGEFDRNVANYGPPPPHFHHRSGAVGEIFLEMPSSSDGFFDTLRRRESTRLYDTGRPLPLGQLVTILHTVWGCQGTARLSSDVTVLKKTSPSGGGLHPCEVYPLIRDVEGLAPGLYHYDVGRHSLRLLRPMASGEVADKVTSLTSGQTYFASAHVVFLLTARFYRTAWKYRNHKKAYRVVLLDAGHLSQTLFLTATRLDLGAFITAAVNERDIEELLGIDGVTESALVVCGCGVRLTDEPGMTLATEPWSPERPDAGES